MQWSSRIDLVDLRELATGGFGKVFRAKLSGRGGILRDVVLKAPWGKDVQAARGAASSMEEEARILAMINHPNIVGTHGLLTVGVGCAEARRFGLCEHETTDTTRAAHELPVLVLEDAGTSLGNVLGAFGGRVDAALAAYVATEILRGLGHLHEQGIVHRDIKPSNILIGRNGEVKLGDLGIAKDRMSPKESTKLGHLKGTVLYMPPEALVVPKNGERRVKLDGRADIWAVGVMLYKLVSGYFPWHYPEGDVNEISFYVEWSQKIEREPIAPLPEEQVSDALFGVIRKCLEKDRDRRFADTLQVIEALQPLCLPPQAGAAQLAYAARRAIERVEPGSGVVGEGSTTRPASASRAASARSSGSAEQDLVSIKVFLPPDMEGCSYNSTDLQPEPSGDWDPEETARGVVPESSSVGGRRIGRGRVVAAGAVAAVALLIGVAGKVLSKQGTGVEMSALARKPTAVAPQVPVDSALLLAGVGEEIAAQAPSAREPFGGAGTASDAGSVATVTEVSALAVPAAETMPSAIAEGTVARADAAEKPARMVGALEVVVLPRGAFVSLDGAAPVRAPFTFQKVSTGSHVVRVGLSGDALERTERIKIRPGVNRLRVELVNPFGSD